LIQRKARPAARRSVGVPARKPEQEGAMAADRLFARDLMTKEVATVPPDMPVASLARLLSDRGISSVPVIDVKGCLLGIITEADLIRRLAGAEDKPAGWLLRRFRNADRQAERYARRTDERRGTS
jgi:CBS-domain-containing membrane protein